MGSTGNALVASCADGSDSRVNASRIHSTGATGGSGRMERRIQPAVCSVFTELQMIAEMTAP